MIFGRRNEVSPEIRAKLVEGIHAMLTAIVKTPAPSLVDACELTFLDRVAMDFELLLAQHAAYRRALARASAQVITLDANPDLADSVFVEDTAVILDEVAILTCPGAPSRQPELAYIEPALAGRRGRGFSPSRSARPSGKTEQE